MVPANRVSRRAPAPGTFGAFGNLFHQRNSQARQMRKHHLKRTLGRPVVIAMAVSVLGMLAMLIVDHGPLSPPQVQTAEGAHYKTPRETAPPPRRLLTPPPPPP